MCKRRKHIFDSYRGYFNQFSWAALPPESNAYATTSAHLFMLRVRSITEHQRDEIIEAIASTGLSVNVHFIPLPMLSLFNGRGYLMDDFPVAYDNYSREISLPIYPQLTDTEVDYLCKTVAQVIGDRV